MIRFAVLPWLIIVMFAVLCCGSVSAEDKDRPLVLIFQTDKTSAFNASFTAATARSLRNYFRQTQRVDAMVFDRGSPTVERAVLDKKLSADSVASYSTREQQIAVAKTLGFQYASGADISSEAPKGINGNILKLNIWLADVDAGRKGVWEAAAMAIYSDTDQMALDNAMQSAASRAVIEVTHQAFAKLPIVNSAEPTTGDESTAIGGARVPEARRPDAGDYISQAEKNAGAGNLAVAIEEYSRAVSADPTNGPLRIKLAETYAQKKMFEEALDTLDRALAIGADKGLVDASRQKIELMHNGEQTVPAEEPSAQKPKVEEAKPADGAPKSPAPTEQTLPKDAAAAAVAKIVEGDRLWNKGDPDEAAKSYAEAIRLNPGDWRAHERLVVVDASMSLFGESRKALERLNAVQPNPSAKTASNRYEVLRKAFDKSFKMLMDQYESDSADFAASRITRESYYSTINGLALRSESMAKFLDALVVPAQKQSASIHRSLACGLFAQAASSMLDCLETNSTQSKANAQTFLDQAKKELEIATGLDENKVVIKKVPPLPEPLPTPDPEPSVPPEPEN